MLVSALEPKSHHGVVVLHTCIHMFLYLIHKILYKQMRGVDFLMSVQDILHHTRTHILYVQTLHTHTHTHIHTHKHTHTHAHMHTHTHTPEKVEILEQQGGEVEVERGRLQREAGREGV